MRKGANGESTSFLQSEPSNEWKIGYAFTVDPIDEKKWITFKSDCRA